MGHALRWLAVGILFAAICLIAAFSGLASARDLALGDSLAVGFGRASGLPLRARVAASSCAILAMTPKTPLGFVLISAGTNDPPGRCIAAIRARVHAQRVTWVVPVNGARARVLRVAGLWGDRALFYTPGRGRVWPHPARGYWRVAH